MEKITKKCPYCDKNVVNLPNHIINMHPKIIEKIEETDVVTPSLMTTSGSETVHTSVPQSSITTMIREKLDIMLNIKIIEMLSNSPETNIQDIARAVNPEPPTAPKTLLENMQEYQAVKEMIKEIEPRPIETGNEWIDLAQQALPIVKDMLPGKKAEIAETIKNVNESNDKGVGGTLKPICLETSGSSSEPVSDSKKSGTDGKTIKHDDSRAEKTDRDIRK